MVLPVEPQTVVQTLTTVRELATKWLERFESPEFLQMLEVEEEQQFQAVLVQFASDLKIAAAQQAVLVEVLR